jgi:antitoxin YefM
MVITASEARSQLFPLIEQVNNDSAHVVITSKKGNAVLVSESEWESMVETMYLLRTRENRERLAKSMYEIQVGELYEYELPITTTSEGRRVPRRAKRVTQAKKFSSGK